MELPELTGSPKQITWASSIRKDRLKVWKASSPEIFKDVENKLVALTDAGWWISYKDKDMGTVSKHFLDGTDLKKIQRDDWLQKEKKQEKKDSAGVKSYLKKELQKESCGRKIAGAQGIKVTLSDSNGDGLMRFESQAVNTRTGETCSDPNCPF